MRSCPSLPILLMIALPALAAAGPPVPGATPAAGSIAGEWGVEIEGGDHAEEAILRFTFENGILAGTFAREGRPPRELTNLRLADGKISFDIEENSGTRHATGTVYEKLMTGKIKSKGEGGPTFSIGGRGESRTRSEDAVSRKWTAYRRPASPAPAPSPVVPGSAPSKSEAPSPETAASADASVDHRFRVSYGALTRSDPIRLTPKGEATSFTASFSLPDEKFVPDPYAGRCRLVAMKSTLKREDQKSVLGEAYEPLAADSEDPPVLHPFELRNAAVRFGANAVYLLLSESESLENVGRLHDCAIVSKDGERYRGELLEEIACRDESGKRHTASRYGGRASFYSCPPSTTRPGPRTPGETPGS
jgi:hypothetical protein